MKSFINNLLVILLLVSCSTVQKKKEQKDITLIIPGNCAEGFILDETVSAEENTVKIDTTAMPEILLSITGNNQIPPFTCNRIIYSRNSYALFTENGIIKSIAGFSPADRVTDDAVKLTDGVDNFIMNYGNSGLNIINKNGHRIYMYKKMGIAIFDDNTDDSIDMYIIFSPAE